MSTEQKTLYSELSTAEKVINFDLKSKFGSAGVSPAISYVDFSASEASLTAGGGHAKRL